MNNCYSLSQLGWQPFFQQQLSLEDYQHTLFGRVTAHHRSEYLIQLESQQVHLAINTNLPAMTVGDWVLLTPELKFLHLLERKSLFQRKAAGTQVKQQYISANVDTLFIVMSLNQDFNLSRLERYLSLAADTDVEPVIVLTKADLCADVEAKIAEIQKLNPLLMILAVNALEPQCYKLFEPWCKTGQTVSFVGSSGVGKSTLINRLLNVEIAKTNDIRLDDDKGKHTTTSRALYISDSRGIIIDTPGMRELQLLGSEQGISHTFADIDALASNCQFKDCQHLDEPGCAVQHAIATGELEPRRLSNYTKLIREQAHNNASLKQKRDKEKQFGKMVKRVMNDKKQLKNRF